MLPDPLFNVFGRGVYMYGICIAVGIIVCLGVFYLYTGKKKMPGKVQDFTFIVAVFSIALGFLFAKLFQAVYDWIDSGFSDFDFYGAGITAMGGFIGGAATFLIIYFLVGKFVFKGKEEGLHIREFNKTLLCAPCCITVAHAFGRIGCLCAGCCHGKLLSTSGYVFGGIYMRHAGEPAGYYVPTQLYESLFLFALFAVLSYLYFHRSNITMQIYLIAYGAWRIFIEIFRDDYRGAFVLGLSPSQWQSIIFIIGGIAMFLIYYFKKIPFRLKDERQEKSAASKKEQTI